MKILILLLCFLVIIILLLVVGVLIGAFDFLELRSHDALCNAHMKKMLDKLELGFKRQQEHGYK